MSIIKNEILFLFFALAIVGCVPGKKHHKSDVVFKKNDYPAPSEIISDESSSLKENYDQFIESHCMGCHNQSPQYGGIDLTKTTEELIEQGIIIPGDAENSKLFYVIKGAGVSDTLEKMPSEDSPPLSEDEVSKVRNYINSLEADTTPPDTPIFNLVSQNYIAPLLINISTEEGAIIRYSLGSSISNCSSGNIYQGAFTIQELSTTVHAVACDTSGNISEESTITLTYVGQAPETPIFETPSQFFNSELQVHISSESNIHYSTDGTDPECTDAFNQYNNYITISGATTTIKATACSPFGVMSGVVSQTYYFDNTPPTSPLVSPESTNYSSAVIVTITKTDESSYLKYAIGSGTELNCSNGLNYQGAITINGTGSTLIKAIACDEIGNSSEQVTRLYTFEEETVDQPFVNPPSMDFNNDFLIEVQSNDQIIYKVDGVAPQNCTDGQLLNNPAMASQLFLNPNSNNLIYQNDLEVSPPVSETSPTVVTGFEGNALSFDGLDDYLDIGPKSFNFSNQLTVSAMVYINSMSTNSNDMRIVSHAISTAEQDHYFMLSERLGRLRGRLKVDGVTHTILSDSQLPLREWIRVELIYDGNMLKLALNQQNLKQIPLSGSITPSNNIPLYLGASPGSNDNNFDGVIDNLKIYSSTSSNSSQHDNEFQETREYKLIVAACRNTIMSSSVERIYRFDSTPPQAPIANIPSSEFGANLSIELTTNEGYIKYSRNSSQPLNSCSHGELYVSPILISETTELKAIACDQAGNVSPMMTESYLKDSTPPIVVLTSPSDGQEAVENLGIKGKCDSDFLVELSLIQNSQTIMTSNLVCENNSFVDLINITPYQNGTITLRINQTDQYGNNTQISRNIIKTNSPNSFELFQGHSCTDANAASFPKEKTIKRKSPSEIRFKILDATKYLIPTINLSELEIFLSPKFKALEKNHHEKMDIFDNTIGTNHIDAYHELFTSYISFLAENSLFSSMNNNSSCLQDSVASDSCIDIFIARIAPFFVERKLEIQDKEFYRNVFKDAPNNMKEASLIYSMLLSSSSIFHEYYENDKISNTNTLELSERELAFKLSYTLWKSIPDQQLLDLATNNQLKSNLQTEVDRLMAHSNFQRSLKSFARNWLKLDHMQDIAENLPAVQEKIQILAANNINITDTSLLKKEVQDEAIDFFSWIVLNNKNYTDLLLSRKTLNSGNQLSQIYQTPVWNGSSENIPTLPLGKRGGLFTRAFNTWSYYATHSPISIGKRVLFDYVCSDIGNPPDNTDPPSDANFHPEMTAREYTQELTEQPGSSCIGCHAENTQLNGKGFVFGEYGSFGERYQDASSGEPIFTSTSEGGNYLMTRTEINTSSIVKISSTDNRVVKDAIDMSFHILETGKGHACLSKKYFEFINRNIADISDERDSCAINKGYQSLKNNEDNSIKNMIKSFVMSLEFQRDTKIANSP